MPKVSVLMPVYNSAKYLHESIESIQNQSFEDFEFLIFDDGSTDRSLEVISSFGDSRIKVFSSSKNLGHVYHLNKGILLSEGQYIARMDSDDISHHERLQRQVDFLDSHDDVGILGTWYQEFGASDQLIKQPCHDSDIRLKHLFKGTAIGHPTVMMRRILFEKYKLKYESEEYPAEDYWLWVRSSLVTKIANIPEAFLYYRVHKNQISNSKRGEQSGKTSLAQIYYSSLILGRKLSETEVKAHKLLCNAPLSYGEIVSSDSVREYLNELKKQSFSTQIIDHDALELWTNSEFRDLEGLCVRHYFLSRETYGSKVLVRFLVSMSKFHQRFSLTECLKIIIKCIVFYRSKHQNQALKYGNSKSIFM